MNEVIEIIKYTLPNIILVILVYILLRNFFKNEESRRNSLERTKTIEQITPNRLQAYERMALLLERIRPTSLIRRIKGEGSVKEYEYELINAIQVEFDHNLSQQIYINPETWKIIFSAKNSTQNFINECVKKLPKDASVRELQEEIIRSSINENNPSNYAMLYLQKDIQGNK
ncbi:MAG: hypothetical protein H6604_01545 [Flavobacteriales bacterium]|nr:hypothetical protein [Flavobacteriales bacterium]